MIDNKEFYILGRPIDSPVGKVKFLKYYEYVEHQREMNIISMNVLHIYYTYKEHFKKEKDEELHESIENIKEHTLYEFVLANEDFFVAYKTIFELVLSMNDYDLDVGIETIFKDEDLFKYMRSLIMRMNMMIEEEVSPNPEIQEYINASKEQKRLESGDITVSDVVSSIVVSTGIPYSEISEMTILQVNATYRRIAQVKSYDTNTLFATVAENVKIPHWGEHINLFEKEKSGMKMSEFNKKYGGLFN